MKRISVFIILVIVVFACGFSAGLPVIPPTKTSNSTTTSPEQNTTLPQPNTITAPEAQKVELHKDNWFDFVNEFWPRYTDAEVIDVATLTRYKVKRVGGYNHADVEPLTTAETDKMYSIYDYQWSWTRRPVWVFVNNRYIAASINGYPHAYDYVSGNNMTGHTCIHFYKSRTHASNNWDPAHKEAVETAYSSLTKFNNYIKQLTK